MRNVHRPPATAFSALILGVMFLAATPRLARAVESNDGWWGDYDRAGIEWGATAVADWHGDIVVSGEFASIDARPMPWAARWNGSEWIAMSNGLASELLEIAVVGDELYGVVPYTWNASTPRLRHWTGIRWEIVPGQPLDLESLVVSPGPVLFARTGSQFHRWDGTTWTTWGPPATFRRSGVPWDDGVAIALNTGQVVVIHQDSMSLLGSPTGGVAGLAVLEGSLVAGYQEGRRFEPNGYLVEISRVRRWDGESWKPMGSSFDNLATHFLERDGGFELVCQVRDTGPAMIRRWNGTEWAPTETWFDRGIEECRVSNGRTIVAGDFWMVDGKTARFLAVDSGTGFAFPTSPNGPRGGADMPVRALLPYRDRLVVGGSFVALSGQSHPFLAIGDGRHWDSPGGGVDNGVFALTEFEGGVVAAGDFTTAGGRPASRIALWDGAEWHPLGDGFDDRVMALVVHEGRLYAGGWFRHSGSRSIRHLAVWDGTNWASAGDIDGSVNALASFRGVLYAGGLIRNGDGVAASSLVRFDGATWEPVADLKGIVLAMASNGHELAIAGQLRGAPWVGGPAVVLWNGSDALPLPWQDTRLPSISAVAWTGRGLVVGGNFEHVKSPHLRNLARWNGSDWESFGTGIDRSVLAVADVNGSLFVGGNFESAGDRLSERLARWDDGAVPLVVDGVTVDRDESRVRLSWNGSGVSNVRRTEVWVGPAESWMSGPAEGGSGTFVGTATDIGNGHFEFVDDSARADGTSYWFRQLGPFEDDSWSGPWALAPLPAGLRLLSIGPNPFLGSAEIHYSTAHAGPLRIDVFDAQGRRVRQLADGEHPAGIFTLAWDGRAESGSPVAAGTYWVRLATRDGIQSRRILRLR